MNVAYAVNGLNQYTSAGGASLSYDANGNMTDDGPTTYTYDVENRLVKAVAGATTTNLVYDPLGRLFEVNQGTSQTTRRFLNDGDALVIEYGSVNQVSERYIHGSNVAADDPLVWYEGGGLFIKHWLHADHLGSIVAVTNSSGGSPSINRYDEYGVPAATNTGRFQYTGQAWIEELGLYYYKARFYSAALGRFMQTDPVGYEGGINLYGYVGNDPVNLNDASGLVCTGSLIEATCDGGALSSGLSGFSTMTPEEHYENEGRNNQTQSTDSLFHNAGAPRGSTDPTGGDRHLTLNEANEHWRKGKGRPVDVDASRLTVRLDTLARKEGDKVGGTVVGDDWYVHGGVALEYRNGGYHILPAPYDFDQRSGFQNLPRNIFTEIGRLRAGDGTAFMIRYHNKPAIYPIRACPNSNRVYKAC